MTARHGASSSWRRPPLLPISAVRARPQVLLILALLAALAVPGAAFGQSAGDEQYSDPFAGEDQQQQNQQPQQQEQEQEQQPAPQPEAPAEPVEQPAAPTSSEGSGEAAAAPAQSSDPSLPVTGLPALTLLALGAGMLASGLLVRRRA
jgi:hypothetical protein